MIVPSVAANSQCTVELGVDKSLCNGAVTLTGPASDACCDPVANSSKMVFYSLDACKNLDPGAYSYDEFTPNIISNCASASKVYRNNSNTNFHSCVDGVNSNGYGMCISANTGSSANFNDRTLRFDVTLSPGQLGQLTKLEFYEKAPDYVEWESSYFNYQYVGINDAPRKYAIRVLKNGNLIYIQTGINTTSNWSLESFDFSTDPDFEITTTTTFNFELVAYDAAYPTAQYHVWDIDNISIYGGCCSEENNNSTYSWTGPNGFSSNSQNLNNISTSGEYCLSFTDCNGCEANDCVEVNNCETPISSCNIEATGDICQGPVTLSANAIGSSCEVTYSWSDGQQGANISITQTGTYIMTAIDCNGSICTEQISITACQVSDVGNFVWFDENQNGIQDAGEAGVENVVIRLYSPGPDGAFDTPDDVLEDIKATNMNGMYLFEDVESGTYCIEFIASSIPTDYQFTIANAGGNDENDSDVDDLGKTPAFTVTAGQDDDLTWDAGILFSFVPISIDLRLQGALDANNFDLMSDDLRQSGNIPLTEPYSADPNFDHDGGETTTVNALSVSGNNAIIDWVLIEVRDPTLPNSRIASRAALLQRDGDVVDTDGINPIAFDIPNGDYHIAVKHRNHLGVMTNTPITIDRINEAVVDFTNPSTDTYGANAQVNINGLTSMWCGSISNDGQVVFQGTNNDVNEIFFKILTSPNNTDTQINYIMTDYSTGDLNMDNQVIFQGDKNDANVIFFNVLNHPANTNFNPNYIIKEQVPK